jgi:hypothetical protein
MTPINIRSQPVTKVAYRALPGGRRHRGSGLPKYYAIKVVAEALDVSPRRWIASGDLVVHRVNGVVRIAEGDLGAFLALHREG